MSAGVGRVVIGMDPHKRSATIEVMTGEETVLGKGRFGTDRDGYAAMVSYARAWPDRVWAIEGCSGIGKHIAVRLLAAGEQVVDVPPKLSARARVFATGQGRKTDATDAHSVALVGTRMTGLRPVVADDRVGGAADPGRPATRRWVRNTPARSPSSIVAAGADPRRGEEEPVRGPGQEAARVRASPRHRRQDPQTRRRRARRVTWRRSIPARKPPTKNSPTWSPRPEPACSTCTASDRLGQPGSWSRSATSPGSPTATTSRPGTEPPPSTPPPATRSATGCPGQATERSTASCTSWPEPNSATPPKDAPTTTARKQQGRPREKPCAASNDACPTSSTTRCSPTPWTAKRQARSGTGATTLSPARPARNPTPTLRKSLFTDLSPATLNQPSPPCLDTEGRHVRVAPPPPSGPIRTCRGSVRFPV